MLLNKWVKNVNKIMVKYKYSTFSYVQCLTWQRWYWSKSDLTGGADPVRGEGLWIHWKEKPTLLPDQCFLWQLLWCFKEGLLTTSVGKGRKAKDQSDHHWNFCPTCIQSSGTTQNWWRFPVQFHPHICNRSFCHRFIDFFDHHHNMNLEHPHICNRSFYFGQFFIGTSINWTFFIGSLVFFDHYHNLHGPPNHN